MTRTQPDPYSRSYWRFADEFPEVYADDAAYALWSRLRDEADKAWPSSAPLPYGVKRRALGMLTDAELVYLQPGNRYRIRGLDKERERRSETARRNADARWDRVREQEALDAAADAEPPDAHSDGNAAAMQPHSGGSATPMLAKPRRDEKSQDEKRRDETRRAFSARDGLSHISREVQAAGEEITGRPITVAGFKAETELDRLCEDHPADRIVAGFQAVSAGGRLTWPQLVYGTRNALEPIPNGRPPSDDDEIAALLRSEAARG